MAKEEGRHLGFWTMVLLGINAIIGSGIFLLPGKIMQLAGNWSIAVYGCVTVLVLAIAWCFSQCAALFQRNGGAYLYAKEAFGDFIGFEIGWMRWVIGMIAWASLIVGLITALSTSFPVLITEPIRTLLIISLIASMGGLNLLGVKLFRHLNNLVTIAKIIPLFLFVLLGIFFVAKEHYTPLTIENFQNETFGTAVLVLFYAFGGFESLVVAAGEMKNPKKNLPLAVMYVISFCSLLYFLIQLIAIGILGDELANSELPLADAMYGILGEQGRMAVTLAMLVSIGGINLSASFITPRSCVAMAEDGMLPQWLSKKGRYGTPVYAILLTIGLTMVLALTGSFEELVVISVVSRFAQYISTCLAVPILYRKHKQRKRTFQQMKVILIPTFALFGVGWMLFQVTFFQLGMGLGALFLGIPIYWIQKLPQIRLSETSPLPSSAPIVDVPSLPILEEKADVELEGATLPRLS